MASNIWLQISLAPLEFQNHNMFHDGVVQVHCYWSCLVLCYTCFNM